MEGYPVSSTPIVVMQVPVIQVIDQMPQPEMQPYYTTNIVTVQQNQSNWFHYQHQIKKKKGDTQNILQSQFCSLLKRKKRL